jgi:hypothetical protein
MTTKEVKLMIIENFIDHVFHDDNTSATKEELYAMAPVYVDEDHVDEIAQANIEWTKNAFKLFKPF